MTGKTKTIFIVTPVPVAARRGNTVTALRWTALLRSLGHSVALVEQYNGEDCDLLVALHARRSLAAVRLFRAKYPGRPLIVALTGTDLYHDLKTDPATLESLKLADRLVVLQRAAVDDLPEQFRNRARVIYQSALPPPSSCPPRSDVFQVCVLAHLRDVKDPLLAGRAARLLPRSSRIQVVHVGGALSEEMQHLAEREMRSNPRYRWLGERPHGVALRILGHSRLLLITSKLEGGANAVSEAIAAGVPVLSTRIPGSVGLLGDQYPGYFPVGDALALANLMSRCEIDSTFYSTLIARIEELKPLVDPARERESWRDLLAELLD